MNKNFIKIISPITVAVAFMLDIASIALSIYAIKNAVAKPEAVNIAFAVFMVLGVVLGIFVTKEAFSNGVRFKDNELEFIGLDKDNIYEYKNIDKVEFDKFTKISFTKNFDYRHSMLILKLKDEKTATIDLGLTSKRSLMKIANIINEKIK